MTTRGLLRSVWDDLRRHRNHVLAGGLGIAVSIAALTFFLALGLGIRGILLGEVFSLKRIEVLPKSTDLNLLALKVELGRDTLDAGAVAELRNIDGVSAVYPKQRLLVPALASGGESLIGTGMQTELVADGIDPALVSGEVGDAFHNPVIDPAETGAPCRSNSECPTGAVCTTGPGFARGECREVIPIIVSEHMVELYNGAFRRAYRLPKVNPDALLGMGIEVSFGASSLRPTGRRAVRHRVELAGFSDAAIPLGITMPLGFVRRLNHDLGPKGADEGFHSAVIEVDSESAVARVIEAVERTGLVVRDDGARRAAFFTTAALAAVGLVGIVLLAVSALHVMHVFALLIMIRRREIGVMRAVGASRNDVRMLITAEAGVIGLIAGALGLGAAASLAALADAVLASNLPDFPFKPDSFFSFEPWLMAAALVLAVGSCVLGALGPALRATAADPADIVAGD